MSARLELADELQLTLNSYYISHFAQPSQMYCDDARLCVCLSVFGFVFSPHAYTTAHTRV